MRSPEAPDVDRIEALLRGFPPETEREASVEGLLRELRVAAPPAPPDLRRRVRELREPEPRRRTFRWRPLLVVAPLAAAFAVGALVIAPRTGPGGVGGGGGDESVAEPLQYAPRAREDAARSRALAPEATQGLPAPAAADRAQEYDFSMQITVGDNGRLSEATNEAIATTRRLGGFVVASSVETQRDAGRSQLIVRVPSERVQDAIVRFSALGTITGQRVSVQDRQEELDQLARRIDTLRVQVAQLNVRLRTEALSEPQRLRLELQRQRLEAQLNQLTRQRARVTREVELAEVSLELQTSDAAAAAPPAGRFDDAIRDALHVLAVAATVALFLVIVLSPLVLLALAFLLARRAYRRRADDRMLDRPHPTAAAE